MESDNKIPALPKHIGFIMDGNRRWGKIHGNSKAISGTAKGVETLENIVENVASLGIKYVTVYAFSSENWNRSKEEVDYLMKLTAKVLKKFASKVKKNNVRVKFVGRISDYPENVQKEIRLAEDDTKYCDGVVLNVAASYGGRTEIVDVIKSIIDNKYKSSEVTEELISKHIYEAGQPDLDLIVRTGGAPRLSGFMMWQSTYSELYFTDVLWPDFDELELKKALTFFSNIKRNFGK